MITLSVESNVNQVIGLLQRGAQALPQASRSAEKAVATMVLTKTTEVMQERIYDRPLPASYARFNRTSRTGDLIKSEVMLENGDGFLITTRDQTGNIYHNPEDYSESRHYAEGPDYWAGLWRTIGLQRAQPQIAPTASKALSAAMPSGLLRND